MSILSALKTQSNSIDDLAKSKFIIMDKLYVVYTCRYNYMDGSFNFMKTNDNLFANGKKLEDPTQSLTLKQFL
jgi:hypothetical protein